MPKPPENPDHYDGSHGVTCLEAIRNALTPDEFRGFLWGNVLKYMWRWPKKNKAVDLTKAKWLIERLIELETNKPIQTQTSSVSQGSAASQSRQT
jgi:hypothetical protein